jgi:hypothetical protein
VLMVKAVVAWKDSVPHMRLTDRASLTSLNKVCKSALKVVGELTGTATGETGASPQAANPNTTRQSNKIRKEDIATSRPHSHPKEQSHSG